MKDDSGIGVPSKSRRKSSPKVGAVPKVRLGIATSPDEREAGLKFKTQIEKSKDSNMSLLGVSPIGQAITGRASEKDQAEFHSGLQRIRGLRNK